PSRDGFRALEKGGGGEQRRLPPPQRSFHWACRNDPVKRHALECPKEGALCVPRRWGSLSRRNEAAMGALEAMPARPSMVKLAVCEKLPVERRFVANRS